jgi:hypothetical protein
MEGESSHEGNAMPVSLYFVPYLAIFKSIFRERALVGLRPMEAILAIIRA